MPETEKPSRRKKRRAPAPAASGSIEAHLPTVATADCSGEPTARLLERGAGALTDAELVSIFLGEGEEGSGLSAQAFLNLFGGVQGLAGFDLEMSRAQRLTDRQTVLFLAAVELGRRLHQRPHCPFPLADPCQVARYLAGQLRARCDQQVLGVLLADASGRELGIVECFRGTQFRLQIDTKPILREALCRNATALLVFWFRPSVKPEANSQDFDFRKKLSVACEVLGVKLLDFLLLSTESWLSLRRLKPW